jgi:hypothetical protein
MAMPDRLRTIFGVLADAPPSLQRVVLVDLDVAEPTVKAAPTLAGGALP